MSYHCTAQGPMPQHATPSHQGALPVPARRLLPLSSPPPTVIFQLYKDVVDSSFDTLSLGPRLEKLDLLHVEGMHYAETHCCKLYMGTLAYSPTLMLWFNQKILWSLVFKKLSGSHVTSHRIHRLAHRCGILLPLSVSIEAALHNYKAAQNEYQDLQPKASQL